MNPALPTPSTRWQGASWESLTDQIEQAATAYIEKIDQLGGAVEAISRGFQQKEIQDSAYAYQKGIETNDMIIVGVNRFTVQNEAAPARTGGQWRVSAWLARG